MEAARLPRCLRRWANIISEVSDERDNGDGYWLYFVPGWYDTMGETHCIHEDTPTQCAAAMKYVEPCKRNCCQKRAKKK